LTLGQRPKNQKRIRERLEKKIKEDKNMEKPFAPHHISLSGEVKPSTLTQRQNTHVPCSEAQ